MIAAFWQKSVNDLKRLILLISVILLIIYFASGIYSVSPNEYGVLKRFGRIISSSIPPGIHYALPYPVDSIQKVPVREARSLTINTFSGNGQNAIDYQRKTGLTSYCITGDNNIVNITFVVQYTFSNPAEYLTGASNPEQLLQRTVERVIIRTIAEYPVDTILTHGKRIIAEQVKNRANIILNKAQSGISISFTELINVSPPVSVQAAFDDVVNANIDRERLISEAESYRNSQLPETAGYAHEILQSAQSQKERTVSEAQGTTDRFLNQLNAYENARLLIHQRLRLDALQQILTSAGQIYIIESSSNTPPANLKIKTAL